MKSYHSGFDYFTPEPGSEKSMECKACNALMDVERGAKISVRSFAPTSSDKKRVVDIFKCPHAGEPWHNQVIDLQKFIRDTPSHLLSEIVRREIETVIQKKQPTKDTY
jgi:hypothetical protein